MNKQAIEREDFDVTGPGPVVAHLPSRMERSDDRRERLTRALAEIREMDEGAEELSQMVAIRDREIADLKAFNAFLEKRCSDLDADRMIYAKQVMAMAHQMSTIAAAAEQGAKLAKAAEALGLGGDAVSDAGSATSSR